MATVLIIEDEEIVRVLMVQALCLDHNVVATDNGMDGLAMFEQYHPDLIIADLAIPEEAIANLIYRIHFTTKTKVIVTSALFVHPEMRDFSRKAGAVLCLSKPLDIDGLRGVVAKLLKKTL